MLGKRQKIFQNQTSSRLFVNQVLLNHVLVNHFLDFGLSLKNSKVWFSNRRARLRKQMSAGGGSMGSSMPMTSSHGGHPGSMSHHVSAAHHQSHHAVHPHHAHHHAAHHHGMSAAAAAAAAAAMSVSVPVPMHVPSHMAAAGAAFNPVSPNNSSPYLLSSAVAAAAAASQHHGSFSSSPAGEFTEL